MKKIKKIEKEEIKNNTYYIPLIQGGGVVIDLNTGDYLKGVELENELIDKFWYRYFHKRTDDYEKVVLKDKSVIEFSQLSGLKRETHERCVYLFGLKLKRYQKEKEKMEEKNREFREKWKPFSNSRYGLGVS